MDHLKIIFIYMGLIIGAGFASGREILEYFNFCSNSDCTGVALACILFIFICYIILKKSMKYKLYSIRDYVNHIFKKSSLLRKFFLCMIFCDLICGMTVMLSSCGEILTTQSDIPKIIGTLCLAFCCFIVFIFDLKGISIINIVLVPVITAVIIFITIGSLFAEDTSFLLFLSPEQNKNILLCSVCYVSYNTLTAASVLSPLTKNIKNTRVIMTSSIIAGALIGVILFLVWTAIGSGFSSLWYESFPLRKLALNINDNLGIIYTACLIMSIFTTAVSEGYGILSYFKPDTVKKRIIFSIVMFVSIIPFSMINFSSLVKYLYYWLGMAGIIWMLVILTDYLFDLKSDLKD